MGCQRGNVADVQARADSLQAANAQLQATVQQLRSQVSRLQAEPAAASPSSIQLEPAIYFPSGSAWLTDRGRDALDQIAQQIKSQYPNRDFRIKGYTDSMPIGEALKDTYPSNWYLSAQRAAAVAHYLDKAHNIQTPTLEIGAYGPQQPVASNETPTGRQQNRRVVIVIDEPAPDPGA
ncbi:OmpA family protein [Salisaeta longa]|uniref:OmpA family protein n=1 Tax=Salisaeta longa TaxID=503170 RepID=UPI0012F89096|nr:OmpA family protein [Salisaeta longa]